MKLENQNILIISNEPWGETWFSKHNYAWELSKKNKVIFVNPPNPFRLFNFFKKNIHIKNISSNLDELTYNNVLPVRLELFRKLNEFFILRKLNSFLRTAKFSRPIFWTFDPIRLTSPEILNPSFILLHLVDKYRFAWQAESIMARKAHLIICVADEIAADYKDYMKKVKVVPHAIASDEIIESSSARNSKMKGVFVGNADKRIDFETTAFLIKKFPEVEFHFVGKIDKKGCNSDLVFNKNYSNVISHGEKPFKELKNYISTADFCFLFKDNNLNGNNISSHKMLQYFAQGKPMFVTGLSKYQDVKKLVYMSNNKEELATMMENFIKNGEATELKAERINYARQHSFENILQLIEKEIQHA